MAFRIMERKGRITADSLVLKALSRYPAGVSRDPNSMTGVILWLRLKDLVQKLIWGWGSVLEAVGL